MTFGDDIGGTERTLSADRAGLRRFCGFALALAAQAAIGSPIDIDNGRQLFVDDWLVESTTGLVRVCNHPVKQFDAPVLWPQTDLEREVDPFRPYRFAPVLSLA